MIAIGDNIITNPIGDALNRQLEYANRIGHIDMIVYSTKKLSPKYYKNFHIYPTNSKNMLTFVFDVLKIAKILFKQKQIDVISTQDPFGTALAGYILKKIYKTPLHIQNHSSFIDNKKWIKERFFLFSFFNILARWLIKRADRLRVVNHEEKEKYIKLGVKEDKIDIAPLPIDVDFWNEKRIQNEKPIILWVGRNDKVKNLKLLFEVVCGFDVELYIVGEMKGYFDLESLEKKYNIKPKYFGVLSHDELKKLYRKADILLSTSEYEGFGMVMAEAQASGCVVIATNTAGAKEIIIDNKTGFIVKNKKEFSEKLRVALNGDLENMKKLSKKYIKRFNKDKMIDDIINSLKKTK